MLNVTKKLKLFVLFTELLSMIWLRRFIAIIALFIFSALSAWAQTQVNSPEGPYDCTGVANGLKERDKTQYKDCCLPTQMVFCGGCVDHRTTCEKDPYFGCGTDATINDSRCGCGRPGLVDYNCGCGNPAPVCGKCGYTKQGCESVRGCGQTAQGECSCDLSIKKVCDKCNYTMQGCESISGCGHIAQVPRPTVGCPTTRCRQVPSNNNGWPMKHSHFNGCPGDFPTTQPGGGPMNFGHGETFYYVTLSANTRVTQACYGRTDPKTCSDPGKSGWIYARYLAGERLTYAEAGTASPRICDNGTIRAGTTLSAPLMYCRPQ